MSWLHNEIMSGFQVMRVARVRNLPEIPDCSAVAEVWVMVFLNQPSAWDEQEDAWRIKKAFLTHMGESAFFPAPKDILLLMPKRKKVEMLALPKPENHSMPEAIRSEVKRIGRLSKEQLMDVGRKAVESMSDFEKSKLSRVTLEMLN